MPIGAITMILTNVGLQIYNNWCSSRQNAQLQQKREEFERAARERNTRRMWQIMREGQELTKALEEERHRQRIDELKNDIGSLLQKLAYTATINNWPLNVLPIVMKNQALGNLLANQEESIALHCIFTPSNSYEFNKNVFPLVEKSLEEYCNQHWSIMGDHPVLFYSGAWQTATAPTEVQIDSMRTTLSNLPTLLITPFFRPNDGKLIFQLRMWGVGASCSDNTEFSQLNELEPSEFQRTYTDKDDYMNEAGLTDEIIEDVVPYLECLIGYMADTYFWSARGLAPCLPQLLTSGSINTDGMKYLVNDSQDYYENLLTASEQKDKKQIFESTRSLELYEGASYFWNDELLNEKLEELFISYCSKHTGMEFHSMKDCLNFENFTKEDLHFIRQFRSLYKGDSYQNELTEIQSILEAVDFDYSILESTDINHLEKLANEGNGAAMYRLGEIYEYSIGVKWNPTFSEQCYKYALEFNFVLAKIRDALIHQLPVNVLLFNEIQILSNCGVEQAIILISQLYAQGVSCEKNIDASISQLNRITNSKHPYYYYYAAELLLTEFGDEEKKAIFAFLKLSADMGYVKAQEKLMMIYMSDTFVPHNPERHFYYANLAAKQGSLSGLTRTGLCLAKGYGINKSIDGAKKILSIAAKREYPDAIKLLNILNDATN